MPSISPSIYLREIRVPADALPLIQGDLSGFPNLRKFTITLNSSTAVTLNLQEMTTVVSQLPVCRQGRGELYIRQGQQIMASTIAEANAKNWDVIRY